MTTPDTDDELFAEFDALDALDEEALARAYQHVYENPEDPDAAD